MLMIYGSKRRAMRLFGRNKAGQLSPLSNIIQKQRLPLASSHRRRNRLVLPVRRHLPISRIPSARLNTSATDTPNNWSAMKMRSTGGRDKKRNTNSNESLTRPCKCRRNFIPKSWNRSWGCHLQSRGKI